MHYLEYGDVLRAYNHAGYSSLLTTRALYRRNFKVQRVLDSKRVQALIEAVRDIIVETKGLKIENMVEMLLDAHSHACSATEEINAIKEISRILGFYEKGERSRQIKKLEDKGLWNLSDYELKRMKAGGVTVTKSQMKLSTDVKGKGYKDRKPKAPKAISSDVEYTNDSAQATQGDYKMEDHNELLDVRGEMVDNVLSYTDDALKHMQA